MRFYYHYGTIKTDNYRIDDDKINESGLTDAEEYAFDELNLSIKKFKGYTEFTQEQKKLINEIKNFYYDYLNNDYIIVDDDNYEEFEQNEEYIWN